MKATTLLRTISLGLMIIGMTAVYARPAESPNPIGQIKQDVIYVVNLIHNEHLAGYNCSFYVLLTDDRGRTVAPPQAFRMGVWTYTLKERGPVTGTRIAKIVRNPYMICPNAYSFAPVSQTGFFKVGQTYIFDLVPLDGTATSGD